MKRIFVIALVLMVVLNGCGGSSSSSPAPGPSSGMTAKLVTQVFVDSALATAIFNDFGVFANGEYCLQHLQYSKDGKAVEERLLISGSACAASGAILSAGTIDKRVKTTSPTSFVLVSDKDANRSVGQFTQKNDSRWYLTDLCALPNAGSVFDRCDVQLDATGHFQALTER